MQIRNLSRPHRGFRAYVTTRLLIAGLLAMGSATLAGLAKANRVTNPKPY